MYVDFWIRRERERELLGENWKSGSFEDDILYRCICRQSRNVYMYVDSILDTGRERERERFFWEKNWKKYEWSQFYYQIICVSFDGIVNM